MEFTLNMGISDDGYPPNCYGGGHAAQQTN
jgi:hypothetical protein